MLRSLLVLRALSLSASWRRLLAGIRPGNSGKGIAPLFAAHAGSLRKTAPATACTSKANLYVQLGLRRTKKVRRSGSRCSWLPPHVWFLVPCSLFISGAIIFTFSLKPPLLHVFLPNTLTGSSGTMLVEGGGFLPPIPPRLGCFTSNTKEKQI